MEYTLLVMAGGIGSRFGGLKQLEPIGPNGEFIIDYSIYDAIKAGFTKVIFIIKKENEEAFKQTIGKRIEGKIKVEYVYQDLKDLPEGYKLPKERTKPWGTGHAIYSARNNIKSSFAVINADDFYGPKAYEILIDFLKNNQDRTHYLAITYKVKNTISENGSVKRALAQIENGILTKITESKIEIKANTIVSTPLNKKTSSKIKDEDKATVNLFAFTPNYLRAIIDKFPKFLDENINDKDAEYLMPNVISEQIKEKSATVYVKDTPDKWHGITYKEDKQTLINTINNYIKEGKYPKNLWQ